MAKTMKGTFILSPSLPLPLSLTIMLGRLELYPYLRLERRLLDGDQGLSRPLTPQTKFILEGGTVSPYLYDIAQLHARGCQVDQKSRPVALHTNCVYDLNSHDRLPVVGLSGRPCYQASEPDRYLTDTSQLAKVNGENPHLGVGKMTYPEAGQEKKKASAP